MRLKTLTIRNLASIEDATIEFDAGPLSQASVFLISGETGSGKSTILDAICLALYNTVPRMEAASVSRGDMAAADNETRSDHVFQLLRKGTAHTQVTLCFTGLYDKEYEAHWGIRRARNKPDGRLQESQMDLTLAEIVRDGEGREVSREEIKRTRKNCAAVTESVIGLSYGQFCRTTMLAQGEFTRFIKSDGAEKSQILAKVTDRSDFFEISRTIHEICAEKNKELEEVNREMSGIELLEDDKKEALEAEIREADALIAGLDTRGGAVEAKLAWLGKEADLAARVRKNSELESALQAKVASEDFTADERRARQWFETELARRDLRSLTGKRKAISDAETKITLLKEKHRTFLAGRAAIELDLDKAARREAELKTASAAYDAKRPILALETQVRTLLSAITSRQKDIADARQRMCGRADDIAEASRKLAAETQQAGRLHEASENAAARSEEARLRLEALDLAGVTKRISDLGERRNLLETFVDDFAQYADKLGDAETLEAGIKNERAKYEADLKKCVELEARLEKLTAEAEKAKTEYETAKLTVEDFTQRLRESLSVGCECPVCRQKVEHTVSFDMTAGLRHVEGLRRKADEMRENKEAVSNEISEERGVLKTKLAEINSNELRLAGERKKLSDSLADLTARAGQLGLSLPQHPGPEDWTAKARAEIEAIDAALAELRQRVEAAKPAQEESGACAKAAKEALNKWKKQQKALTKAAENDARLKSEQKADEETIARSEGNIAESHASLVDILDVPVWGYDNPARAVEFEKSFADCCEAMRGLDAEIEKQQRNVTGLRQTLDDIQAECDRIASLRPDFAQAGVVEPQAYAPADGTSLTDGLRELSDTLGVGVGNLDKLRGEEKELAASIAEFIERHPGYDSETLLALDGVTRKDAERLRDECQEARTNLRLAALTRVDLEAEGKALAASRPDIAEAETAEALRAESLEIKELQADANRRKGAAQQKLDDDRKNREKTAGLKEEADRLEGICRRWRAFDDRLGSASGDKFNRIAQSYVLSDLLDRANVYLAQLTDRYRLAGQPGTFAINLVDRLQGGAMRSVHSASGGEGFLVSLSLALALGDLGNRLSVDPLFIDEGFGTLSGAPLQHAIDLLNSLRRQLGRRVGVISHIAALRESIPVQLHMVADPDTAATSIELWQNNLE